MDAAVECYRKKIIVRSKSTRRSHGTQFNSGLFFYLPDVPMEQQEKIMDQVVAGRVLF